MTSTPRLHPRHTATAALLLSAGLVAVAGCASEQPTITAARIPGGFVGAPAQTRASAANNSAPAEGSFANAGDLESRVQLGGESPDPRAVALENEPAQGATESKIDLPSENPAAVAVDGMDNFSQVSFAHDGADFDPRLSRDGQWMVFSSTQHSPNADIYVKSVSGRTVTQLTSDAASDVMPAISPDGTRIAFASNRSGSWNLYLMPATGGQAIQLSVSPAHELHPSWSPDGKRLAFCRLGQMSGRWELWVMEVAKPQAAEFIGYGLFPEWCPQAATGRDSADKILFQRARQRGDRAYSLWTVDYKPGSADNFTEVVAHRGLAAINASWSPSGMWVVYTTARPGQPGTASNRVAQSDIWIASIDGANRAPLTAGRFANAVPVWGGDNRIYFASDRGGIESVWSMSADKALAAATGMASGSSPLSSASEPMNEQQTSGEK